MQDIVRYKKFFLVIPLFFLMGALGMGCTTYQEAVAVPPNPIPLKSAPPDRAMDSTKIELVTKRVESSAVLAETAAQKAVLASQKAEVVAAKAEKSAEKAEIAAQKSQAILMEKNQK